MTFKNIIRRVVEEVPDALLWHLHVHVLGSVMTYTHKNHTHIFYIHTPDMQTTYMYVYTCIQRNTYPYVYHTNMP